MRPRLLLVIIVLAGVAGTTVSADRVRLRSGKVVAGVFIGGDSRSVRLLLDSGEVSEVPLTEAVAVEFTARKPPAAPAAATASPASAAKSAPATAAKTTPAARRAPVVLPAGTVVNVRLAQAIDVDASKAGMTFRGVVDDPVSVGGSMVVPRGASATIQAAAVEQSGKMKGSDKISLKLNSIAFGGSVYEISTAYVEAKGKGEGRRTARKVGGGAGLGALVGGIAGGGEGAAIGAAVGGVTGAAVAGGGEEHLTLPAETRLQFRLSADAAIGG